MRWEISWNFWNITFEITCNFISLKTWSQFWNWWLGKTFLIWESAQPITGNKWSSITQGTSHVIPTICWVHSEHWVLSLQPHIFHYQILFNTIVEEDFEGTIEFFEWDSYLDFPPKYFFWDLLVNPHCKVAKSPKVFTISSHFQISDQN